MNVVKPTESELSILQVLWRSGPSTVREVNTELNKVRDVGYTNTLKIMQIMHDKGLLGRDESRRSHVYYPETEAEEIKSSLLKTLIDSVFDGSTSKMMLHALGNYKASEKELDRIRDLLNKLDDDDAVSD